MVHDHTALALMPRRRNARRVHHRCRTVREWDLVVGLRHDIGRAVAVLHADSGHRERKQQPSVLPPRGASCFCLFAGGIAALAIVR